MCNPIGIESHLWDSQWISHLVLVSRQMCVVLRGWPAHTRFNGKIWSPCAKMLKNPSWSPPLPPPLSPSQPERRETHPCPPAIYKRELLTGEVQKIVTSQRYNMIRVVSASVMKSVLIVPVLVSDSDGELVVISKNKEKPTDRLHLRLSCIQPGTTPI